MQKTRLLCSSAICRVTTASCITTQRSEWHPMPRQLLIFDESAESTSRQNSSSSSHLNLIMVKKSVIYVPY